MFYLKSECVLTYIIIIINSPLSYISFISKLVSYISGVRTYHRRTPQQKAADSFFNRLVGDVSITMTDGKTGITNVIDPINRVLTIHNMEGTVSFDEIRIPSKFDI